jgi:hypothetical protein
LVAMLFSRKAASPSSLYLILSASKRIEASAFRRFSTLLAIKILQRFKSRDGSALMLTDTICVKYGSRINLSEASTMRFISENTDIPVSKVFCSFIHSGRTYIVIERIKGDIIANG